MEFANLSDKELNLLLEKYKEKQLRYNLMLNEVTLHNERILLKIHLEQTRRFEISQSSQESKMDISN
jgi:hypothetical protein